MKLRIVIDVVNTILFHRPSISILYSSVLERYGYMIKPSKIRKARKKILITRPPIESKCLCNNAEATYRKKWSHLTNLILKECGICCDINEKISNEIHFNINNEKANVIIKPSFVSVLAKLQNEGCYMGILSNGYSSIKTWLKSSKAYKYFDFILISSEIGHLKPCPFAFQLALKEMRENGNIISIFVGDDLYEDGFGAILGGFDNAIIIKDSKPDPNKSKKIIYISTFKLLPKALKEVKKYA